MFDDLWIADLVVYAPDIEASLQVRILDYGASGCRVDKYLCNVHEHYVYVLCPKITSKIFIKYGAR